MKRDERLTDHHCVAKCNGGSNHGKNISDLLLKTHQAFHIVFGTDLPHEGLKTYINIIGNTLIQEVRDKIIEIIDVDDVKGLYDERVVNDWKKFNRAIKGK